MGKINLPTAAKNLKKNLPLLLSTLAALCLFISPSLTSLLMIAVVFVAVAVAALLDRTRPTAVLNRFTRLVVILNAIFIAFMGYDAFRTTWMLSGKAAALANALHFTTPIFLLVVGAVGCMAGFYAMYVLSYWIIGGGTQLLKNKLPVQNRTEIVYNLKRNWFFPISAMAFFCLSATLTIGYLVGLLIAFMAAVVASTQIPSLLNVAKQNGKWRHIVAVMTALGICWGGQSAFYADWRASPKTQALEALLPFSIDVAKVVSIFGAVVALFFVYFCVLAFWKEMTKIVFRNGIFDDVNIPERVVYSILCIATVAFMVFSFAQTEAFYGTEYACDIIYTSDSPYLVKGNVHLALAHTENDLRQPLFAVFAAPFVGIPYLFGKLIGASASVQAMLINAVQIIMLFAANFMLAKMMKLNPMKRICFVLLTSCTYTHLLFTLMLEQYIVAYFWLVFCLYLIIRNQRPDRIALWGAGGTLLTSMVLLPFISDKNPVKNFREWFADMVKYGLEFIAIILVFCRFDVIFNLTSRISFLSDFTGKDLTFIDKLYQYISFVANCFVAPDAGVNSTAFDHISWQMNPVSGINFMGVAILLLIIISAILNKEKKSSLLSAGWIAFSAVILLGLGWGTMENGLILYALYFGWAFWILLFQLVEKIEDKLNIKFLIPVFSIGCAVALAAMNVPAIMELLRFAITYFPV